MSKRDDGLFIDALANRWRVRNAPAAGATAVANVNSYYASAQLSSNKFQHNVTSLSISINNGKGAAATTVTASISDASIGGTVLADWDFVVAAAGSAQVTFANLDLPGLRGNDVFVWISPPSSSAVAKVSAAGWTDSMVNG